MAYYTFDRLSDLQYDTLVKAANTDFPLIVTAEPPFMARELKKDAGVRWVEIRRLERLGLIQDVSDSYKELLADEKVIYGRFFKVFTLTPETLMLFKDSDHRLLN